MAEGEPDVEPTGEGQVQVTGDVFRRLLSLRRALRYR
jgi:hypothetical protein